MSDEDNDGRHEAANAWVRDDTTMEEVHAFGAGWDAAQSGGAQGDDDDDRRIPPDYGVRGPLLVVSVYRDRGCTDLAETVRLIPGVDTLTVDRACTLRFNETT